MDRARNLAGDIVAVLDEQALERGRVCVTVPTRPGRVRPDRQPHDWRTTSSVAAVRLGRHRRAVDLGEHEVERGLALLV